MMQSFAKTYQNVSDTHHRDQLILEHLDYVSHILSRIVANLPSNVDIENLQSAGVVGLIESAAKYDPSRGIAFKTYCYPRIKGAIIDELRANSPLSQKMMETVKTIRAAMDNLQGPYDSETIAQVTKLSLAKVEQGLEAMRMNPLTLDSTTAENSKSLWSTELPNEETDLEEKKQELANAIESLPKRERLAITLYYLEGLRLKEIGVVMSISESRASRVLANAELRLKQLCGVEL